MEHIDGQANIEFLIHGKKRRWGIAVHLVNDNWQTIEAHLKSVFPEAMMLSVEINDVRAWKNYIAQKSHSETAGS